MSKFYAASLFVLIAYATLSVVKIRDSKISNKELQILLITKTHFEKGTGFTKGLNVYPESPADSIYQQKGVKMGGVPFDNSGKWEVYVSCPPLVPLVTSFLYPLFQNTLKTSSVFFIASGLLLLWSFFLFAKDFLEEKDRPVFMLLSMSPFVLTSYFYNDINLNPFMLSFSLFSYLALIRYATTGNRKWLYSFGICYGMCIWSSFFTLSLIPSFFLVIFALPGRKKELTKKIFWEFSIALAAVIGSVILYHIAVLPGFMEKLAGRVHERIGGVEDLGGEIEHTGQIPFGLWMTRLLSRFASNYSPVLFLLGLSGFCVMVFQFLKKKQLDTLGFHGLCFFTWGFPATFILKNGSYVHPYFLMYFVFFFPLAALVFLKSLDGWLGTSKPRLAAFAKYLLLALFLGFTIPRSYLKVSGMSIVNVLYGGKLPSYYESK